MLKSFSRRNLAILAAGLLLVVCGYIWSSDRAIDQWKRLRTLRESKTKESADERTTETNDRGEPTRTKRTRNVSFAVMYNTVEDAKLQLYVTKKKHKIKAVIYFLVKATGFDQIYKSIELLYENFNKRYGYPVVIFHEADFLPMVESLRQIGFMYKNSSAIFFQLVDLGVPDWYIEKFGKLPPPAHGGCNSAGVGYRSMCRFQAKLVYEHVILSHFDYYWRLDDDSRIMTRIPYDVFDVLKTGGFSYGFYKSTIDTCAHKMFDVTRDYIKSRRITPTFFNKLRPDEIFFNNFEVSNFKFWRSRQYRDFMDHIDSLGGIYKHRWGDAPIKTLALSLFVPLREIYRFRNFTYRHSPIEIANALVTDFLA